MNVSARSIKEQGGCQWNSLLPFAPATAVHANKKQARLAAACFLNGNSAPAWKPAVKAEKLQTGEGMIF